MAQDYTQLVQTLSLLATQASTASGFVLPADFLVILPNAIAFADNRMYREFTFLAARTQDASLTFSGTTRSLSLQNMTTIVIVPEGLSLIAPVGAIPALGIRYPFEAAELGVIDIFWPQESLAIDPRTTSNRYWALRDQQTMVVGPTPDAAYSAEITGLFQPAPISATNPTTYLYTVYPTAYQAACMIYITGWMRNFGAQSDNPKIAVSWEDIYTKEAASIKAEEDRRRIAGTGWSPYLPTPLATPPRT